MSHSLTDSPYSKEARPSWTGVVQNVLRQRLVRFALCVAVIVACLNYFSDAREYTKDTMNSISSALPKYNPLSDKVTQKRRVHLLLPANHKDKNLCKSMISSLVLGYPPANIINWGEKFDDEGLSAGGSHLGKLPGISNWLKSLPAENDDDLVIAADAYDVWFQLRPETLIQRYYDIVRRANDRIRGEIGEAAMKKFGIEQSIVFSAQKKCGIKTFVSPYCNIVPESTLPEDVFGPQTDVRQDNNAQNPDIFTRPRSLNSGTWAGRVGPLRKLFAEATRQAEEDGNWGSDQRILSHIYGEQETWRAKLRESRSRVQVQQKTAAAAGLEYGVGLDFESSMGIPTVFSEDDLAWIRYNDTKGMAEESKAVGIDPPKLPAEIAADISSSRLPFADADTDDLALKHTEWATVNVFTNLYSGFAPVMIHHNAWREGRKNRRQTWWNLPFFSGHLREMLSGAANADASETVATVTDAQGATIEYSRYEGAKGKGGETIGALDGQGAWMSWSELCDEYSNDIFADTLGPWTDPTL